MADRVGVMNAGRLEQLDTPENVYRNPATAFVAEFVGAMNHVAGRIGDGGEVLLFGQRVAARPANGTRPGGGCAGGGDAAPRVAGGDSRLRRPGRDHRADLPRIVAATAGRLDGGQEILVEAPSHGTELPIGARVSLKVIADRVVVAQPGSAPVTVPAAA